MRCYNRHRPFYCGIDCHARTLYLCVGDAGALECGAFAPLLLCARHVVSQEVQFLCGW